MTSKKKPRPLFEVPIDIESSRESGWVYRSNGHAEAIPEEPGESIIDTGSNALALSLAAIAQTLVFALKIAAVPCSMSLRALGALARPRG
jgi:hypothetical protein